MDRLHSMAIGSTLLMGGTPLMAQQEALSEWPPVSLALEYVGIPLTDEQKAAFTATTPPPLKTWGEIESTFSPEQLHVMTRNRQILTLLAGAKGTMAVRVFMGVELENPQLAVSQKLAAEFEKNRKLILQEMRPIDSARTASWEEFNALPKSEQAARQGEFDAKSNSFNKQTYQMSRQITELDAKLTNDFYALLTPPQQKVASSQYSFSNRWIQISMEGTTKFLQELPR